MGEKGLSLARIELSVTITALGGSLGVNLKAVRMSDSLRGVPEPPVSPYTKCLDSSSIPFTTLKPICGSNELGFRTNAVTVWPMTLHQLWPSQ